VPGAVSGAAEENDFNLANTRLTQTSVSLDTGNTDFTASTSRPNTQKASWDSLNNQVNAAIANLANFESQIEVG